MCVPELPEVEVMKRDLEKEIVGRRIKDVEVRAGTNAMKVIKRHGRRKEFQDLLTGAKVDRVDRVGKWLLFHLDNGQVLLMRLGDSGTLLKTSVSDDLPPHTHLVIRFTIGGQLTFSDPHRLGEVFAVSEDKLKEVEALNSFMLDPLDHPLTWNEFSVILQGKQANLRELLLDESFLCGFGDIYADEILWTAGLRYDRPCNKLTSQDVRRLWRAVMETLQDAVKAHGTTLEDRPFRDLSGDAGQYQVELKVFEREGESCRRCRSAIVKETYGSGYTYLCAQCQS
jgi:formamidopyrimidine-DNA glycosylase